MYSNAGKGLKVSPFVSRCGSLAASVMIVVAAAEEKDDNQNPAASIAAGYM